ncbi:peptidase inhibitor family I36 protein [Streptomyces sp. NBC_00424]|uniref:peptidase inhibitor family I36 protein n=1 Tax=Streptomyces sp. NBC_00424 TaxID=2903648 RepID=UPI002255C0FD|nr:peptidase inhibitor family I36 protein [Streptomyces sp. NBC_00424]MCX5078584.1 peptidase inhibitor family I36 protein [Streptomyces sp. NBC_00424]
MKNKITLAAVGATLLLASTMGTALAQDQTQTGSSSATAPAGDSQVIKPVHFSGADARIKAWDQCHHGQACLFQNSDGGGSMWVVPSCNQIWNLDPSMNNRTSSLWNRAGSTLNVYNGNGGNTMLGSYGAFGPPINLPGSFNDKISSVYAPCGG